MGETKQTNMTSERQNQKDSAEERAPRWIRRGLWVCFIGLLGYLLWNQQAYRAEWKITSARKSLLARNPEHALELLSSAQQLDPDNGEVEYLKARAYRKLGQLDLTREHLQQAHALRFDLELLEREQWLAAAQAGQMSIAEPHLRELFLDPRDDGAEICEAFVNGYLRNHHPDKALPLVEAWKQDFPEDDRPHHVLGSYYNQRGDYPLAEKHYREALNLAPDSSEIRSSLAANLIKQQKFEEAEVYLKQNLKDNANSIEHRLEWADFLWQQGKTAEAVQEYRSLEKTVPELEEVRWGIARWLAQENQYEESLHYLAPLVEESPYNGEYRRVWARALQSVGRVEEAKQQYEWIAESTEELLRIKPLKKQLTETPNDTKLLFEMGRIYLHYESPELGLQILMGVLDLEPDHEPARTELYDYFRQRDMPEMAERFKPKQERQ